MKNLPFQFGAEVYTWFMDNEGETHAGRLGHMIEVASRAGFEGIEPMHFWMGELSNPDLLKVKLRKENIKLSAIALILEWNGPEETKQERQEADQVIELLKRFPGALLCTVQMPTGRHDLEIRREHLINNVNSVSRRAAKQGINCSFHPNSPESSINRTEEDYRVILEGLDEKVTGWTPDVGHIINGGMDPLDKMKEYKSLINHVHYKDWNGDPDFALMGKGGIDFTSITQWLKDEEYDGWIVCEDEAPEAVDNPDEVTLHDGEWIRRDLIPSLN